MPASPALTPLGVMALGLLRERPMHAYEMMRLLRRRGDDRLVAVTNGTFYHTVARLQRHGWVAEVGVDRDGNRPERTTFEITGDGIQVSDDWVRGELPLIDRPQEFRVALAEAHDLPRDEVRTLLNLRAEALTRRLDTLRSAIAAAHARSIPAQFLVELDRESHLVAADVEWLDGFLAGLADPATPWGIREIPAQTMHIITAYREASLT